MLNKYKIHLIVHIFSLLVSVENTIKNTILILICFQIGLFNFNIFTLVSIYLSSSPGGGKKVTASTIISRKKYVIIRFAKIIFTIINHTNKNYGKGQISPKCEFLEKILK